MKTIVYALLAGAMTLSAASPALAAQKYELRADKIGARLKGGIEGLRRADAADLDLEAPVVASHG